MNNDYDVQIICGNEWIDAKTSFAKIQSAKQWAKLNIGELVRCRILCGSGHIYERKIINGAHCWMLRV